MVGMQYNPACRLFALTSKELPGLLLAGNDPTELWADVPAVVKALYRVGYGMDVQVLMEATPAAEEGKGLSFMPLHPATLVKVEPRPA